MKKIYKPAHFLLMGAILIFSHCTGNQTTDTPIPEKPNIILILADDLGYGDISVQNPESKIPTPHIDRLASQGTRFTDAHASDAVCSPTRYSILTGRYSWRTELKSGVLWEWDPPLIKTNRLTVADMLKNQGYNTACIGKWHLGWEWNTEKGQELEVGESTGEQVDWDNPIKSGPTDQGFDYYFGDDVPNFAPYIFIENKNIVGKPPTVLKPDSIFGGPGVMQPGWEIEQVMPKITEKAVEYISGESKSENPFFLYFPLTAPHTPVVPLDKFKGRSEAGLYGDFVTEVDWSVGQVMHALKENGIEDNTLVIFTSDNGPEREGIGMNSAWIGGKPEVNKYGHFSSLFYRGQKRDIWEGGHRVPFIVRYPGKIPEGKVSDELISSIDFMGTMAGLLGIEISEDAAEDSYNMWPAFKGQKSDIRDHLIHHSSSNYLSIRKGKWKFIDGKGSGGNNYETGPNAIPEDAPPGQLYNMQVDYEENNNLYREKPEIVQELKALLEQYKKQGRSVKR